MRLFGIGRRFHQLINCALRVTATASVNANLAGEADRQQELPATVRESADKLEKLVADDLWPLPKYSEILFIK